MPTADLLVCRVCITYMMNDFMKTRNYGRIINDECYNTIRFADNIALLGNNEEELQNTLHHMNKTLKYKSHMTINKEKTKTTKYSGNEKQKPEIFLDGGKLVQVDGFKYLASW